MPVSKECLNIFNKNSDSEIEHYLDQHQYHQKFDVFIYLNNEGHACILCAPKNDIDEIFKSMYVDVSEDDPFQIEGVLFVWSYKLQQTTGAVEDRILRKFSMFKDLQQDIAKLYYIGKYENAGPNNFDFAALKAIPDEDLGTAEENDLAFVVKFCEFLVDFSDACKNEKAQEEIMQNIKEVKNKLSAGRSKSSHLLIWMKRALSATIKPSDLFTIRGLILLFVMLVVYPLFVAFMMKVCISTDDE